MKKLLAIMMLAAVGLFALEGKNILLETDFPSDPNVFPGCCGAWNVDSCDGGVTPITILKNDGPQNANAVRLNIPMGEVFRQQNITLVPGEKYRFGAYFRTKAYQSETVTLRVWNRGWTKELVSPEIPKDTDGKWVKIELTGTMPTSPNDMFTFGVYAKEPHGGLLDMAAPYLIPLSQKAADGSSVTAAAITIPTRIIPVYPLLHKIDVDNPTMRFFVPNRLENTPTAYEVWVQTQMENDIPRPWGIFDLGPDRIINASLGNLPLGNGKLYVKLLKRDADLLVAENEYDISVIKLPPKANLKKLNNMVAEILDAPLKNGEVTFENPREGWVFIGFDNPYPETKAYLDGADKPVVAFRQGELSDTMRLLPIGKHTLRIEGAPANGRLLIRAVAQIMLYPIGIADKTDFNNFRYDLDFWKKHLLHSINLLDTEAWVPKSDFARMIDAELAGRGKKIVGSRGLWRYEPITQVDKMVNAIKENPTLKNYWGITIDELGIGENPATILATTDALWKLTELEKRVYLWVCGVTTGFFSNPLVHHELLSAGANVSRGEGKIFLETYVGTKRTEAEAVKYLEFIPRQLEEARKLSPDAAERFMMLMSGYTTPEVWCLNNYPQADIKVLFDMFFNMLANDKRLDGLYGMGCYSIGHTDEELVRWIGKLMRYYCVDGGTESLAKRYGFTYNPGHIKDGDFEQGLTCWTAEPAETDSIIPKTIKGYGGNGIQWRIARPGNLGDTVALFTRSAKAPNKLSQTAVGLTPGKLYCLSFMSTDYDDLLKPRNAHTPFTFDAAIEDADILPERSSLRLCPQQWYGNGDYKPGTPEKAIRRIVFRARKNTAKITFSDWKSDTEPGGKPGVKRVVNWISVNPYFQD